MSSWLFYGEWILCIPGGLQSALASTSQRTAKKAHLPPDILEQGAVVWGVRHCWAMMQTQICEGLPTPSPYLSLQHTISLEFVFTLWHHLGGCDIENRGCPPKSPIERISLEQPLVVEGLSPSSPPSTISSPLLRTPYSWVRLCPFVCAQNLVLWPRPVTVQMFLSLMPCYQCLLLLSSFLCFPDSKEF